MAAPSLRPLLLACTLFGCASEAERRCRGELQAYDGNAKTRLITLEGDGVGPIQAQIIVPWAGSRYEEGAPTAVFVHGSWSPNHVPLGKDSARILTGHGIASVYLNLPGGAGDEASDGDNDQRGPGARAAVALALRYASGDLADTQDCLLADRVPDGSSGEVVLSAFSNGGNLAWATLADESLDLPDVVGVATFETPAAGQFATAEPGTETRESPIYETGTCDLDASGGIVCDIDYGPVAWDGSASPETGGVLFVDVDGNGRFGENSDFPLGAVREKDSETWAQSLPATLAAESAGVLPASRLDSDSVELFWFEREAPRAMAEVASRFPELAGIEVGTETDHVLQGATDHPHVTGMVAAMQASGIAWDRLHPDAAYVSMVSGLSQEFVDLPAGTPVDVGDTSLPMEPSTDDDVRSNHYLTAATLELLDRSHEGEWASDLDDTLTPF